MTWHPNPIYGRFLSPTRGFAGVSGSATNANEYRDLVDEEPFRLPYPLSENSIMSPNVPKGAEMPDFVGSRAVILRLD